MNPPQRQPAEPATTPADGAAPRPFGRQPLALRGLREALTARLTRRLRETHALDDSVHVKAFWLRADDAFGYGSPDYQRAYVWIAPVITSPTLCEAIRALVAAEPGVVRTGRGGGGHGPNPLRPYVYAVIELRSWR